MRGVGLALLALGCSGISQSGPGDNSESTCPLGGATPDARAPEAAPPPAGAQRAICDPSAWRVTASSSAEGDAPSNAIDGLPVTRWSAGTGQGPGHYLQVSFAGLLTLSRLTLVSGGSDTFDYLRGYEIRASRDGVNFEAIVASGGQALAPPGGIQTIDFFPTALQALRIESIQPSGNRWSVNELSLDCYGSDTRYADPLTCVRDVAAGAPSPTRWTSVASRSGRLDRQGAAFDDDMTTSWSTGAPQTSTDWFQLDLGEATCISALSVVSPEGESANAFAVEVSEDAVHFVQVAEGLRDDGPEVRFSPHSARYVRINQVGSGASNWWRIQELQVWP